MINNPGVDAWNKILQISGATRTTRIVQRNRKYNPKRGSVSLGGYFQIPRSTYFIYEAWGSPPQEIMISFGI